MLTPDQLEALPRRFVQLWQQVEDDILQDIARRMKSLGELDPLTPTAIWQAWRLAETRAVRGNTVATLAKYTGKSRAEIKRLLETAGVQTLAADDAVYTAAGLDPPPVNQSPALLNLLNAGYRQTCGTWQNLTATTANTVTGAFEDRLSRAWGLISTGAMDYNTAICRTVNALADTMPYITYPSGHTDTLEVAARRAVLTGVNQTCAKLQLARMEEMDCEFVEVTAHEGARPTHAVWQGRVYHRGGAVVQDGERYEDFEVATGYGTGPGLCGWCCRHNFYPFYPGVSVRNYTDERLAELDARSGACRTGRLRRGGPHGERHQEPKPGRVSRLVKRAGADTTLKNAVRDGAEWAWVPHGDTCPFCITLASNGWQKASSKVLKGGHADHIHANCDCEFAIRFDHNTTVAGYDPDKYLKQYRDAGGDINKMRRVNYAANKERINAQKRAAYAVKNALPKISNFNPLPENQVVDVLRKEAQPWIDKLSAVEQDAIQKYTYNPGDQRPNRFFERINRMLRGDSEEDAHLRMYAERISDALKRSPLEHDVLCYRAMEFNPFDGMHVGDIVCPGQFYSTSVVKSGSLKKDFRITICARSGSLAGYVEPLSKFKEQRELLFDKDTLYRVLLLKEKEVVLEVTLP